MDPRVKYRPALMSPVMVGDKDRAGWVDLFDPDGFVEDPVEAGQYRGVANIELFWDVFIGPQPSVSFDVTRDFWGGDTLIRQCTVVNITQAHPDRTLDVPALIRYTLRDDRVFSLRAIWRPRDVVGWFVRQGGAGLGALGRHGVRMMTQVGLGNGLLFGRTVMGGLREAHADALVEAVRSGEASSWAGLRSTVITVGGPEGTEEFSGRPGDAFERLAALVGDARLGIQQRLICGRHVAAFLTEQDGDGALALMLETRGPRRLASMTALWSPSPRVLSLREGSPS